MTNSPSYSTNQANSVASEDLKQSLIKAVDDLAASIETYLEATATKWTETYKYRDSKINDQRVEERLASVSLGKDPLTLADLGAVELSQIRWVNDTTPFEINISFLQEPNLVIPATDFALYHSNEVGTLGDASNSYVSINFGEEHIEMSPDSSNAEKAIDYYHKANAVVRSLTDQFLSSATKGRSLNAASE